MVDIMRINAKIKCPYYPMMMVQEAWRGVPPGMRWFTTVDLSVSYW